jgi:type VI secretion system secreted protein VgrG
VIFPLRPGMEVDIGFANGDPDRPVITGSRYNHRNPPPRFNHLGSLPENRALSGIVTREFKGSRQQQLRFDDTEGAINVQLASDHGQSELNLGFLRTPMDKGKADPRGEGVELRTLAAAVVRAAQGILLLTEAHGTPEAKQLQREELKASLSAAVALMERLDGAARTAKAHDSDIAPMKKLGDDLKALDGGTNVAEGQTGGKQPVIGIAGTAGVAITTPKSTMLATGENLDMAVNGNLQQAVNRQWTLNAGGTISLFAAGQTLPNPKTYTVSLIAGAGAVLVQAQKGPIHLEAEQEIRIGSNATVKVDAQGAVVITESGGAQLEMKGGNMVLRMPGTFTVYSASYSFLPAANAAATLPSMPGSEQLRDWLGLYYLDPQTGEGIDGAPYEVRYGGGATLTGTLNTQGKAKHPSVPNFKLKEVIYKPRPPKQDKEYDPLEKLL